MNYVPFIAKSQTLNEIIRKLISTAKKSNLRDYIYGKGENEEETSKDKQAKFKFIKFLYLGTKGASHTAQAKQNKDEMNKILAKHESMSPQRKDTVVPVVTGPSDVFSAEHGHHSDAGSSGAAANQAKRAKIDQKPNKKGKKINARKVLNGIFFAKVMKNQMPLQEFLKYREYIVEDEETIKWFNVMVKIHSPKILPKKTIEYFELPEDVAINVVKNDADLSNMIENLQAKNVNEIGIDTESALFDHSLQLIQIATKKECFLIRRKYLHNLSDNLRIKLGKVLSTKFVLFFAGSNDSDQLCKFLPECDPYNMLDIQKLVKKLGFKVTASDQQIKAQASLSDCVQEWLQKPLNKGFTLSNWETNEELSHGQTTYAVLDAWVLIPLFEAIQKDPRYTDDIETAIARSKFLTPMVDVVIA